MITWIRLITLTTRIQMVQTFQSIPLMQYNQNKETTSVKSKLLTR